VINIKEILKKLAEAVRFELTKGCPLPVFKTGAIDHSATPPRADRILTSEQKVNGFYGTIGLFINQENPMSNLIFDSSSAVTRNESLLATNAVLRNTYFLLSLTLLFSSLTAWFSTVSDAQPMGILMLL
jgi:hypothetical protein